jgi:hypothetical protein
VLLTDEGRGRDSVAAKWEVSFWPLQWFLNSFVLLYSVNIQGFIWFVVYFMCII